MASQPAATVSVQSALADASGRLGRIDARVLLAAVLGRDSAFLIAHADQILTGEQALTFDVWVARRAAGEPVAYITGCREFYGRPFHVTPDVLIPRPETELLVDVALSRLRNRSTARVLDLGTGSGCIAITLAAELAGAHIIAVDRSEPALAVARGNAEALGIARIDWRLGDWFSGTTEARFDLIVSNPPYVAGDDPHLSEGDLRYELCAALTPGGDGLDAIRLIVRAAPRHLGSGGMLAFEHGYDQGAASRTLLAEAGFAAIETHRDLAGLERVTAGTWAG